MMPDDALNSTYGHTEPIGPVAALWVAVLLSVSIFVAWMLCELWRGYREMELRAEVAKERQRQKRWAGKRPVGGYMVIGGRPHGQELNREADTLKQLE